MDVQILEEIDWRDRTEALRVRLEDHVTAFRNRRARRHRDVVSDFLFEYYAIRSRTLLRWSPGLGTILVGAGACEFLDRKYFGPTTTTTATAPRTVFGVAVQPNQLGERRRSAIDWIRTVLENTAGRPPFFGCSGMHEWAMIGADREPRHAYIPLRYRREEIRDILKTTAIACSHFDAFRFFAPENRELNVHQPNHDSIPSLEQPGCLHANMDVLRWSLKLYPFVPSELIADAFELALEIRAVDMRASPYDLSNQGLEAIAVETPDGKAAYRSCQLEFYERAQPLRRALIDHVVRLQDVLATTARTDNKHDFRAFMAGDSSL